MRIQLTHQEVMRRAFELSGQIARNHPPSAKAYGVPRGGVLAAYALRSYVGIDIVEFPEDADFIIDDLVDSGTTRKWFAERYPNIPFYALLDKEPEGMLGQWIDFPWECDVAGAREGIEGNVRRLLQFIGENPDREGLKETPARVAKAWAHWCQGYHQQVGDVLKVFEDGGETYNQMILVKDIPFYSHCEHHLAPFFGTVTLAYIPNKRIVGLSKLSRICMMFAHRLQVQERMTEQIADALNDNLQPKGVGICVKARHLCMESRGIQQQGHHTITTALRGLLLDDATAKAEFLQHVF
jgi:GTP cyclohydrolase I